MAHAMYSGPIALSQSKYASPQRKAAPTPTAFLSVTTTPQAITRPLETIIATKEQIGAMNTTNQNANAQLAVAQGNALKQEVEKYTAKLSANVSRSVKNTRDLLKLLHDSLQGNGNDISTVESLWVEMEQLFAAAQDAKAAMPAFLEKQRNNMSLYHASMMNETIRDTQDELNIQHKKVNIQHSLILEHQEAFQDYKVQTASKLNELNELQERVSRLTLEKGNFRTEIDAYKQLLEKEKLAQTDGLQKADALQKELETLLASKTKLQAECDTVRHALKALEEQMKVAEERITNQFSTELQAKADQLSKESQKTTSLNVMIGMLKGNEATAKMEADKVKTEYKAISEKYKNQTAEHAKSFTELNEQKKKIDALTANAGHFRKENADLKQQLGQLSKLQKEVAEFARAKTSLQAKVDSLTLDASAAKEESKRAKMELNLLAEKVKKLEKEVDQLETENNDLLSKQGETKRATQALTIYKNENEKLRATVDELRAKTVAPRGDSSTSNKDTQTLEGKIKELEQEKTGLQGALEEWTELAKGSYQRYKEMVPMWEQADKYRQDALNKDKKIKDLTLQLSNLKGSNSSSAGGKDDIGYWKGKYESLLASLD